MAVYHARGSSTALETLPMSPDIDPKPVLTICLFTYLQIASFALMALVCLNLQLFCQLDPSYLVNKLNLLYLSLACLALLLWHFLTSWPFICSPEV